MDGRQDGEYGFNSEQVRHKLVTQLLNGTETGVTDEGFISRLDVYKRQSKSVKG